MSAFSTRFSFLKKHRIYLDAVDQVSFQIRQGEVFGLVGESGEWKIDDHRAIAGLYKPTGGHIHFMSHTAEIRTESEMDQYRQQMQMIFQDPFSSLNPRMVLDIVAEPIRFRSCRERCRPGRSSWICLSMLALALRPLGNIRMNFPAASGSIFARALATRPRFLICDEPTSALDVSIQAQILNLLKDLQSELGLTMLFISHDLPVIRQMCDRVGVMHDALKLLEVADTETLFESPQHEYSQHLLHPVQKLSALSHAVTAGLEVTD